MLLITGVVLLTLAAYGVVAHFIDYRLLKNYHFGKQKWCLNISCSDTDGGGVNADIIKRDVPNFVLVEDIYSLPFKDKQFNHVICSHTIEHVDHPEKFFKELQRVSNNVTLLLPPVWDLAALLHLQEHKWHFLTLRSKHTNKLPKKLKTPYWGYQKKFGQRVK